MNEARDLLAVAVFDAIESRRERLCQARHKVVPLVAA